MNRAYGRAYDQLRPLKVQYDVFGYAAGSVLFEQGTTKVLCAVTLQNTVPVFLKNKKTGWLTAEYSMLPTATHIRKERDSSQSRQNGRSVEISRLIGRVLRSVVNLDQLGERTIVVDCDVLQADGSTRTACITGAYLALKQAVQDWLRSGKLSENIIGEDLAAVSVGLLQDRLLLDLDFSEDSIIDADFNFVITQSGKVIEIQGSAEKKLLPWQTVTNMYSVAYKGITEILQHLDGFQPEQCQTYKPFNGIRVHKNQVK